MNARWCVITFVAAVTCGNATAMAEEAESAAARKIIDRAIEAAGGREALKRYEKPFRLERKGKASGGAGWVEFTMKVTTWLPDKFRTEQESVRNGQKTPFGIRFNGKKGFYLPAMKEMDAGMLRGNRDLL